MKLQDHPLWPTICEWINSSPSQIVPFAPKSEFQRNVDLAALVDPCWGHANAKDMFWQDHRDAEALRKALVGGRYDIKVHELLYRMSSHSLGGALCLAAKYAAYRLDFFTDFSDSTRLDGFVIALEVWAKHFLQQEFNGKDELPWVVRNLIGVDERSADFWLTACQQSIGDTVEFQKAFAKETGRTEAAARMKKKRGHKQKHSKFREWIRHFWVSAAFWCKSDSEIVSILAPEQTTDMVRAYNRVRRDIFDLGYTPSRRKLPDETLGD